MWRRCTTEWRPKKFALPRIAIWIFGVAYGKHLLEIYHKMKFSYQYEKEETQQVKFFLAEQGISILKTKVLLEVEVTAKGPIQ